MADKTLTIVYNTTTGVITHSGLTGNAMPAVVAKVLATLGVSLGGHGPLAGRLLDKGTFGAVKRAHVIRQFNRHFDHYPNPYPKNDSDAVINESGPFSDSDVTLTVDDGTKFANGDQLKIDDEILTITNISTHDLTVSRGQSNTTAAAHADGSTVYIISKLLLALTSA